MREMFLVDKPVGMSSFGVVARMRRALTVVARREAKSLGVEAPKKVKVGHTGTLDPFATGLLIVMAGKGTKRCGEFLKLDKEYVATMRLGEVSTTGDPEGEISVVRMGARRGAREGGALGDGTLDSEAPGYGALGTEVEARPSRAEVAEAVGKFVGKIKQQPPMYSAIKINGRRAYELARRGEKVEMPEREVEIYKIEILSYRWPELTIRAEVSSGTYIRTLAEDIGRELGVGAYLTALRRTRVGEWSVDEAVGLERLVAELGSGVSA